MWLKVHAMLCYAILAHSLTWRHTTEVFKQIQDLALVLEKFSDESLNPKRLYVCNEFILFHLKLKSHCKSGPFQNKSW